MRKMWWAGWMTVLFLAASIFPVAAQEVNLALNKPITPHTNIQQGAAESVVDGDLNTVWYSWQTGSYTEISFTIDLTVSANVEVYRFSPRQLTSYKIETSVDGTGWVERSSGSIAYVETGVLSIDNIGPHQVRYIRFTGSNNQNAFAGLAEIQVFAASIFSGGDGGRCQGRCRIFKQL